jgi:hypothetical protein
MNLLIALPEWQPQVAASALGDLTTWVPRPKSARQPRLADFGVFCLKNHDVRQVALSDTTPLERTRLTLGR